MVQQWDHYIHKESININGIGGQLQTEGFIYIDLNINGISFKHKFHVLKNIFCESDGILGQDFLRKYNCLINYENNTVTLSCCDNKISIPLKLGRLCIPNYLSIPPRCEKIFYIDTSVNETCVVVPKELCDGVFLACSIATPLDNKLAIQILNTREDEVNLTYFNPECERFSDYDVCTFDTSHIDVGRVKKVLSDLDLTHLNDEERNGIQNICAKYADIFCVSGDKLTTANLYEQNIQLKPNSDPVYIKQYRLPFSQRDELEKQITKMLNDDIIEPTRSEWSSPLLLVPKKIDKGCNKRWRLVIDFRKLNERIVDDKFPLPNITDILDSLSGAMYFSHLDLHQAYYQLPLNEDSRKCTAFTTPSGQYQMKRLPMGLKTSPSAFSRAMTVAMAGLNYDKVFVYLDDLICYGRNLQQHNKNLMDVFSRLRKVNLKLNASKCEFLKKELLYLGHVVSSEGVKPDPNKIIALQKYPTPQNSDDIKRFVAFANYYRKFIPNFATITIPLNQLCRKNASFHWSPECETSFIKIKNSLISPPILQYPKLESTNTFILKTDASGFAIGSVLCNQDHRPVAYASRTLNKAEINYPTIEKELLSVVWSIKYFRPYLYGRKFIIETDHRPLIYLFNMSNPSSRLTKFRLLLEEYDFEIHYVKGKENVAADALSRIRITSEDLKGMNEHIVSVLTRAQRKKMMDVSDNPPSTTATTNDWTDHPRVVELPKRPQDYTELVLLEESAWKKSEKEMTERTENLGYIPNKSIICTKLITPSRCTRDVFVRELTLLCNKLKIPCIYILKTQENVAFIQKLAQIISDMDTWTGPRLCIVKGVRKITDNDTKRIILNDFHMLPTSGHAGIRRMLCNIRKYYFWPGLENDVTNYVKRCDQCQRQKYSKYVKEPMVITNCGNSAFERVYIDIVGPLVKDNSNNQYILTLQCDLTKYVEAYPLPSKNAEIVASALVNNFILRYGLPRDLVSDRGSEFISNTMQQVCKILNITQLTSTAYHHQTIGSLENSHKHLIAFLRIQTQNQPHSWSTWVPFWCFSYNTTVHTETKYTPYELVFGKQCVLPSHLSSTIDPLYNSFDYPLQLKYKLQVSQQDAKKNLELSKHLRKEHYDSYINPITYKAGDFLLLKNEACTSKLDSVYIGPFEVVKDCGVNVIILDKFNKQKTVHKNRTKMYFS